MPKPFRDLIAHWPPERRRKNREIAERLLAEMELQELRKALQFTQVEVADTLDMNQAALSKIERQRDMRVSTLRKLLLALGAELKVVACFPEREVVITQFTDESRVGR